MTSKPKCNGIAARAAHAEIRKNAFIYGPFRVIQARSFGAYFPAVNLFCGECGKHISSKSDWICGYCGNDTKKALDNTNYYSFLNRCVACSMPPGSFICPHCDASNQLSNDRDDEHAARIIGAQVTAIKQPTNSISAAELKRRDHLEKKEELERQIEIALLNKRLKQLQDSPEFKDAVSAHEKIEKEFSDFDAERMGFQILERKRRTEIDDEYLDEPELREMKHLVLDAFMVEKGLTPNRGHKKKGGVEPT